MARRKVAPEGPIEVGDYVRVPKLRRQVDAREVMRVERIDENAVLCYELTTNDSGGEHGYRARFFKLSDLVLERKAGVDAPVRRSTRAGRPRTVAAKKAATRRRVVRRKSEVKE